MSKSCEFLTLNDSLIRDRIVRGVYNKDVQEKLLNTVNLTLDKAVELCRNKEISKVQVERVQGSLSVVSEKINKIDINSTNDRRSNPSNKSSKGLGIISYKNCGSNHEIRNCSAYGKKCNRCRWYNHFEKCCRQRRVNQLGESHHEESSDKTTIEIVKIFELTKRVKNWVQIFMINNNLVEFIIDTGAQVNLISYDFVKQSEMETCMKPTNVILEAFGGSNIYPMGKIVFECSVYEEGVGMFASCELALKQCNPLLGQ